MDNDIFIVKLDDLGNVILYCTYEDSNGTNDRALHICLDSNSMICVSAVSTSLSGNLYSNIFYDECLITATRSSSHVNPPVPEKMEVKEEYILYPNPNSNNEVYINRLYKSDEKRIINIFNMQGQLVFTSRISSGLNRFVIDVSAGVYSCIIYDESGKMVKVEKLVRINE